MSHKSLNEIVVSAFFFHLNKQTKIYDNRAVIFGTHPKPTASWQFQHLLASLWAILRCSAMRSTQWLSELKNAHTSIWCNYEVMAMHMWLWQTTKRRNYYPPKHALKIQTTIEIFEWIRNFIKCYKNETLEIKKEY